MTAAERRPRSPVIHAAPVDVIVPAYRDADATRRCLESVLKAPGLVRYELVVINDSSPEAEVSTYLETLSRAGRITLIGNDVNLGFVASVNRGMGMHPDRDVVLLNSDTEVANDWLDRLAHCAYRNPDIGTVTPFSNNATICSFPVFCAENPLPFGLSLQRLDAAFASVHAGQCVDLPTAVGFCMYIRRACLNEVGLFDEQRFGRGYGEENDFSLRAAKHGWRNVLGADTFVFHAGGRSFRDERQELLARSAATLLELHPDYPDMVRRFLRCDPLEPFRRAVEIELACTNMAAALSSQEACAPIRVQLHVVHDLGGGIARWYRDYCRADEVRTNLVLKPFCHGTDFGSGLMLFTNAEAEQPCRVWAFTSPIPTAAVQHAEYQQALDEIIRDYCVDGVLVSSLIGHALHVLDTGLPTVFIQHDYFPVCPAINLYFKEICGHCDNTRLSACQVDNPDFNPFLRFDAQDRIAVRERFQALVDSRKVTVVFPCHSAKHKLARIWPGLDRVRTVVIPHGYPDELLPVSPGAPVAREKLRVVVLGMLSVSKGVQLLTGSLDQLLDFADIYLVGAQEVGELFVGRPGVHLVSRYGPEELHGIVDAIRPDLGLLLSIWPETYSYTLTELIRLGIPAVATRVGAFAERIIDGDTGFLFEPQPDALVARMRELNADRDGIAYVRANLMELPRRLSADMVSDYHRLMPCAAQVSRRAAVTSESGRMDALVVSQAVDLSRMWKEQKSLHLMLAMKEIRLKQLDERMNAVRGLLAQQERQLGQLRGAGLERDRLLSEIRASTSWTVSKPVRWIGTGLRKARATGLFCGLRRKWRQARILAACFLPLLRYPGRWAGIGRRLWEIERWAGPSGLKQVLPHLPRAIGATGHAEAEMDQGTAMRVRLLNLPALPRISILVPVFNPSESMLRAMLDSVLAQIYPNWELCIADDASSAPHVHAILKEFAARESRIRLGFAVENGGVSHATNRALAMAEGDFVILLDHDDILEEQALFRVAEAVLEDDPDMLYSDEVLVGEDGKTVQHFIFRPMFSPEYLRSHPYIVHLIGFRPGLLRELGGLDETLRISQDYDLVLRASERAGKIVHIPEVLYHWRVHGGSAGHEMMGRVMETSRMILQRHLHRCGEEGAVTDGPSFNFFDVRYPLDLGLKVAILIPTKNHGELVRACIESIERTAGEVLYEIVLVDHESDDPASLDYFDSLRSRVTLLRYSGPFNFAAINNWAVRQLDGSHTHYLFCNNDVEAIETGWLGRMLELGQKPDVGIVGAKLCYPDRKTIQHAGVVVACCGVAENLGRFRVTSENPLDLGYIGSLVCNREVSAVTAACMLIRGAVFKGIGGFDETIAVGYGDVDLCLRVGKQGYRTLFCAHAVLLHHESFTRGCGDGDPHPEDSMRFVEKWRESLAMGDPYFNPNLSPYSPNWQVAHPLELRLDIKRRIFERKLGCQETVQPVVTTHS